MCATKVGKPRYNPNATFTKHTLDRHIFADTGVLNHKSVETILRFALRELKEMYPHETFSEDYLINVRTRPDDGSLLGHSFIWVDDIKFFYALIGKNIDGSERIIEILDPEWKKPEKPYDVAMAEAEGDWGEEAEVEKMYEPKMIQRKDPLDIIPARQLNKQEMKLLRDIKIGYHTRFCTSCHPSHFDQFDRISNEFVMTCDASEDKVYSDMTNEMIIKDVPDGVTKEDLFEFFHRFENDKEIQSLRGKNGKYEKVQYPVIEIIAPRKQQRPKEDDGWSTQKKKRPSFGSRAIVKFSPRIGYESAFMTKLMKKFELKGHEIYLSIKMERR